MIDEIWKNVVGYEGLYEVSNLGKVRSLKRPHIGRIRKPQFTQDGYYKLNLSKHNKRTNYLISRIVATAFIPNPLNKSEINHKDCDKTNNRESNLEWHTHLENMRHAGRNGRLNTPRDATSYGETKPGAKLNWDDVLEIRALYPTGAYTYAALGRIFNVHYLNIRNIVQGWGWKLKHSPLETTYATQRSSGCIIKPQNESQLAPCPLLESRDDTDSQSQGPPLPKG